MTTDEQTRHDAGAAGRRRGPVPAALMLSISLVALDSTIVATAVPSIVTDLGGFAQFPWLFSIYVLAQAVTVPLYGRFADIVGRRPVLLIGIAAFVAGSALCGAAWSMPTLIVARGLQGIGAGAVQPITVTIVGDLYSLRERAKIQGAMASVWGASAVIGPTVGGLFAQYATWRWVFWINLPLAALAVWMLLRHYREKINRVRHQLDVAGAALLTLGCGALVLGLLQGGVGWAWRSLPGIGIFVAAGVLLSAFVLVERRAAELVLPLWVFRSRTLVVANLVALVVGALTLGLSSYVPTYAQGVAGTGAVAAGFVLASMTIGWPLAASISGRIYLRFGFRSTAIAGSLVAVAGCAVLAVATPADGLWPVAIGCFVIGVGMGFTATPTLVAVQTAVDWQRRGTATGTNMFTRSLGSALGVAVLGAIANSSLSAHLAGAPAGLDVGGPHGGGPDGGGLDVTGRILDEAGTDPAVAAFLRDGLYDATHLVFIALVVVTLGSVLLTILLPRRGAAGT